MNVIRLFLLFLHIVGVAAVLGGFLHEWQAKTHGVTRLMVGGADLLLLTGLLLVGARTMQELPLDHIKVGVKLVLALAVAVCAHVARKRGGKMLFQLTGVLTTLNVGVAVFW